MPRTGKGGRRTGTPGTAYSNRTDLNTPAPLPIQTIPGGEYGSQTAQRTSQQAVPMADGPLNGPGAGASPVTAPPGASPQAAPPPSLGLPAGLPGPGELPALNAPTDRPDEHVMSGVPAGPGPGPETLTPTFIHPLVAGVAQLNQLGANVSPQIKALRQAVNAQLANQATP